MILALQERLEWLVTRPLSWLTEALPHFVAGYHYRRIERRRDLRDVLRRLVGRLDIGSNLVLRSKPRPGVPKEGLSVAWLVDGTPLTPSRAKRVLSDLKTSKLEEYKLDAKGKRCPMQKRELIDGEYVPMSAIRKLFTSQLFAAFDLGADLSGARLYKERERNRAQAQTKARKAEKAKEAKHAKKRSQATIGELLPSKLLPARPTLPRAQRTPKPGYADQAVMFRQIEAQHPDWDAPQVFQALRLLVRQQK